MKHFQRATVSALLATASTPSTTSATTMAAVATATAVASAAVAATSTSMSSGSWGASSMATASTATSAAASAATGKDSVGEAGDLVGGAPPRRGLAGEGAEVCVVVISLADDALRGFAVARLRGKGDGSHVEVLGAEELQEALLVGGVVCAQAHVDRDERVSLMGEIDSVDGVGDFKDAVHDGCCAVCLGHLGDVLDRGGIHKKDLHEARSRIRAKGGRGACCGQRPVCDRP